jgi:hypothetical protein
VEASTGERLAMPLEGVGLGEFFAERLRAERAEAAAEALRIRGDRARIEVDAGQAVIDRLTATVAEQVAEIARLRDRVTELETAKTRLAIDALIEAVVDAIERGGATLDGLAIKSAQAEVKAALQVDPAAGGLVVSSPVGAAASSLSTVRLDIGAVPPPPGKAVPAALRAVSDARDRAAGEVRVALLALQQALEALPAPPVFGLRRSAVYHDAHRRIAAQLTWPTAEAARAAGRRACKTCKPADVPLLRRLALSALAATSNALADPTFDDTPARRALAALSSALTQLAEQIPAIRPTVADLGVAATLPKPATAESLLRLARPLQAVTSAIAAAGQ